MDITLPAREERRPVDHSAWQLERNERRLGMCSLDPIEIDYHFARARRFRELAEQAARQLPNFGATGTKGSSPQCRE